MARPEDGRITLARPFRREEGWCWQASLSGVPGDRDFATTADDEEMPHRSSLWLYEDGTPLGPAHAAHDAIRRDGAGAFSHWRGILYFSTSDGTDPNTNGRLYEIDAGSIGGAQQRWQSSGVGGYYVLRHLQRVQSDRKAAGKDPVGLKAELATLERQIVEASGRFDEAFYRRSYHEVVGDLSPLDHFLTVGHSQGLLASARFDPVVYKILHPLRRHDNPLIDSILSGDASEYRDVAALFADLGVEGMPISIRYAAEMEAQWTAKARAIVENRDRSAEVSWNGIRFELLNPSPDSVMSRIAEDRPFCFARLPHGFWDDFGACRRLAANLQNDVRCRLLSEQEVLNLSVRLFAGLRMSRQSHQCYESFFSEIDRDLLDNPRDEDFWTALSLKGVPTFDDSLLGFNEEDVQDRIELLARYFNPRDTLYDATLWKRWALSGDLAKLPDAVRDHPVIVLGPPQFRSLGAKWRLLRFWHVEIPSDLSHLIRQRMLEALAGAVRAVLAECTDRKPIVLFQCSGELSYWIMRRLRARYPEVFYIDLGQALDLWHWRSDSGSAQIYGWAQIYDETLRTANPFILATDDSDTCAIEPKRVVVSSYREVSDILKSDYLRCGLSRPASIEPIIRLTGRFERRGLHGWWVAVPQELASLTDDNDMPTISPLVLLENGDALGRGHNQHDRILEEGGGLYSFWNGGLYFSTSDNSDPHGNGRTYEIAIRVDFAAGKTIRARLANE